MYAVFKRQGGGAWLGLLWQRVAGSAPFSTTMSRDVSLPSTSPSLTILPLVSTSSAPLDLEEPDARADRVSQLPDEQEQGGCPRERIE